jgi:drug/metabolite transporter (DMT)-like permease
MHQDGADSFSSNATSGIVRPPRRAFAALIASNLCLALGPLLVRLADVGPVAAAFWRVAIAAPLLIAIWFFSRERIVRIGPGIYLLLALAGVIFALDLGAWHIGIHHTKLANATLFGNTTSLMLPIYGFIVARAWPSRNEGMALLLAAFGAALLMGRSYQLSAENLLGDLLCVFAGVCYTIYFILMMRARTVLQPWSALILSTFASILPLLLIALLLGEVVWPRDWTPLIALAVISQVIGQGLVIYAMVHFQPIVLGLALLIQPAVAATIGWALFGERLGPLDLLGAIAVAIALVLVRRPGKPAARTFADQKPDSAEIMQ